MKIRPKIQVGDVVKLSKKGINKYYGFDNLATMIVKNIDGDGIDFKSNITVLCDKNIYTFKRDQLWKTGFNIYDEKAAVKNIAPANNNGRENCYVCNKPTKSIMLLTSVNQICENSNCRWFEN